MSGRSRSGTGTDGRREAGPFTGVTRCTPPPPPPPPGVGPPPRPANRRKMCLHDRHGVAPPQAGEERGDDSESRSGAQPVQLVC